MAKLIEIQYTKTGPAKITVQKGDLLQFKGSGGHIIYGSKSIELLGSFLSSLVDKDFQILAPMGAPDNVIFIARAAGEAGIDVVTGDPWGKSEITRFQITVE